MVVLSCTCAFLPADAVALVVVVVVDDDDVVGPPFLVCCMERPPDLSSCVTVFAAVCLNLCVRVGAHPG